ncbi:hypothetical protein GCM10025877_03470 [Agromyces mangrovi Wang et al. 2018]|nr:hypothetical protein GCM10025877_03470 [Agromyces mangrovi]
MLGDHALRDAASLVVVRGGLEELGTTWWSAGGAPSAGDGNQVSSTVPSVAIEAMPWPQAERSDDWSDAVAGMRPA